MIYFIKAQFRISRNLREGPQLRVLRVFWATVYIFKAMRLGIMAIRTQQGLSSVWWKGQRWAISNWPTCAYVNLARKGEYAKGVPQVEIQDVHSIREYLHRFRMGSRFYLGSWYEIDIQNRLYFKRALQPIASQ